MRDFPSRVSAQNKLGKSIASNNPNVAEYPNFGKFDYIREFVYKNLITFSRGEFVLSKRKGCFYTIFMLYYTGFFNVEGQWINCYLSVGLFQYKEELAN